MEEQRVCESDSRLADIYVCFLSLSLSLAAGAHCQVPAAVAQRSGSEKLHEHPGESGAER